MTELTVAWSGSGDPHRERSRRTGVPIWMLRVLLTESDRGPFTYSPPLIFDFCRTAVQSVSPDRLSFTGIELALSSVRVTPVTASADPRLCVTALEVESTAIVSAVSVTLLSRGPPRRTRDQEGAARHGDRSARSKTVRRSDGEEARPQIMPPKEELRPASVTSPVPAAGDHHRGWVRRIAELIVLPKELTVQV